MREHRNGRKRFITIACAATLVALGALGIWSSTRSHSADPSPAHAAAGVAEGRRDPASTEAHARPSIASRHRDSPSRVAASSPLPPPGTPLAQVYDELKARADA